MKRLKLKTMRLAELLPAAYRARRMKQDTLFPFRASVSRFPQVRPPVWNKQTKTLVDGHELVRTLIDEGETKIQVVVVDLPLGEEKALAVALNSEHLKGEWTEALPDLLDDIRRTTSSAFDDLRLDLMIDGAGILPASRRPGQTGLWNEEPRR